MPRTRKSPQEKKRLSLSKDRRNVYGENDKSSRKNIPRRRAKGNRRYRHALKRSLDTKEFGVPEPAAAARVRRQEWRKVADVPLREKLARQRESARFTAAARRASAAARPLPTSSLNLSTDVHINVIKQRIEGVTSGMLILADRASGLEISALIPPGRYTKNAFRSLIRHLSLKVLPKLQARIAAWPKTSRPRLRPTRRTSRS